MQIPIAFFKAAKILLNEKPDVVLGIGGYASGPTCLAAFFLCIPTAITDQNAHPGLTNRILGKFVKKIFLSFSAAQDFFKKNKTYITGNPVRAKISYSAFPEFKNHLNILVCGGSQGSQAINQAVGDAMKILAAKNITIHLTHQTGTVDEKKFYDFYNDHQIPAKVLSFIDDMNAEYQKAQLVICRSGAGTVTELALAGRPAILIPYPFAADDHQKKNALVFTENHAAWLLEQKDLSGEILAALIEKLKNEPHLLEEASVRIKSLGKPDATQKLVDGLFALAG